MLDPLKIKILSPYAKMPRRSSSLRVIFLNLSITSTSSLVSNSTFDRSSKTEAPRPVLVAIADLYSNASIASKRSEELFHAVLNTGEYMS